MIAYPEALKAVGGAKSGITPVSLLDIVDVNGNIYFLADRAVKTSAAGLLQTLQTVVVSAKCVPWRVSGTVNSAYPFSALTTGIDPVSIAVKAGQSLGIKYAGGLASIYYPLGASYGAGEGNSFGTWDPDGDPSVNGNATDYAGQYASNSVNGSCLLGAWADATGQMLASPFGVGNSTSSLVAPIGATQLLLGMNDGTGSPNWSDNTGSWTLDVSFGSPPTTPEEDYSPWILSVPQFSFHRSLQTDIGNFVLQNLSGDTLSRDFEKIMRRSALEGAFFVYRLWQVDAQAAWLEVHGTLTVEDVGVDTVTLKGVQSINPAQDDTPAMSFCETCQWNWASPQCGSTETTECQYSYQTCQVVERILVALNDFEKNYGETAANTARKVINRRRRI